MMQCVQVAIASIALREWPKLQRTMLKRQLRFDKRLNWGVKGELYIWCIELQCILEALVHKLYFTAECRVEWAEGWLCFTAALSSTSITLMHLPSASFYYTSPVHPWVLCTGWRGRRVIGWLISCRDTRPPITILHINAVTIQHINAITILCTYQHPHILRNQPGRQRVLQTQISNIVPTPYGSKLDHQYQHSTTTYLKQEFHGAKLNRTQNLLWNKRLIKTLNPLISSPECFYMIGSCPGTFQAICKIPLIPTICTIPIRLRRSPLGSICFILSFSL